MTGVSIEKAISKFKAANGDFVAGNTYSIIYLNLDGTEEKWDINTMLMIGRSDMNVEQLLIGEWYQRIAAYEYIYDFEYPNPDSVLSINLAA